MEPVDSSLRSWLTRNNYLDVRKIIDEIIEEWKIQGNKQRRNWWDILAGDKNGHPRKIAGREIPVLRSAQIRKGVKITPNSICRNIEEAQPAPINENNRWNKIKLTSNLDS